MTQDELQKVFNWLEENVNQNSFFYFKLIDKNEIGAYWKVDNKHFADFYIEQFDKESYKVG